jgi:hypothetical protein
MTSNAYGVLPWIKFTDSTSIFGPYLRTGNYFGFNERLLITQDDANLRIQDFVTNQTYTISGFTPAGYQLPSNYFFLTSVYHPNIGLDIIRKITDDLYIIVVGNKFIVYDTSDLSQINYFSFTLSNSGQSSAKGI